MKDKLVTFGLILLLLISLAAYGCGIWVLISVIFTHQHLAARIICFIVWTILVALVTLFFAWCVYKWNSVDK